MEFWGQISPEINEPEPPANPARFNSFDKNAPPKSGIKRVVRRESLHFEVMAADRTKSFIELINKRHAGWNFEF